MSESAKRAGAEEIKCGRKEKKAAERKLREEMAQAGFDTEGRPSKRNGKCPYLDAEEERLARGEIATEQFRLLRSKLPVLLGRLEKIRDPRNPKKIKYAISLLMTYGILIFVFQMSSRRQANETMTRPMFLENPRLFLPELESLPHCDTLARLPEKIDVGEIRKAHFDLIRDLIGKKKFARYLIKGRYPVAADGTGKLSGSRLWDENLLERAVPGDSDEKRYCVYVLEASLAFSNSMGIPLASVFPNYDDGDPDSEKQDCELKAFKRLSALLKKEFRRLPIIVLLDGLYPNGPVFEACRNRNWDFMIVLKDKSLKSVRDEYDGLKELCPENRRSMKVKGRVQRFRWVNDIACEYGDGKVQVVHVAVCRESWTQIDEKTNEPVEKNSKHAWISSMPLDAYNLHARCNLAARRRWNIENQIQDEKCNGYNYSHCYACNWNAMKGFHFPMNIAVAINELARNSEALCKEFIEKGFRGFIGFVRETLSGPWLDKEATEARLRKKYQLRLA